MRLAQCLDPIRHELKHERRDHEVDGAIGDGERLRRRRDELDSIHVGARLRPAASAPARPSPVPRPWRRTSPPASVRAARQTSVPVPAPTSRMRTRPSRRIDEADVVVDVVEQPARRLAQHRRPVALVVGGVAVVALDDGVHGSADHSARTRLVLRLRCYPRPRERSSSGAAGPSLTGPPVVDAPGHRRRRAGDRRPGLRRHHRPRACSRADAGGCSTCSPQRTSTDAGGRTWASASGARRERRSATTAGACRGAARSRRRYKYGDDGIAGWSDSNDQFRHGLGVLGRHPGPRHGAVQRTVESGGPSGRADHRRPRVPRERHRPTPTTV